MIICRMCSRPVSYIAKRDGWVHSDNRMELCAGLDGFKGSLAEPECDQCGMPLYGADGEKCVCDTEDDQEIDDRYSYGY